MLRTVSPSFAAYAAAPRPAKAQAPSAAVQFSGSTLKFFSVPAIALAAMTLGAQAAKAGCDDDPLGMPPGICADVPAGPNTPQAYEQMRRGVTRPDLQLVYVNEAKLNEGLYRLSAALVETVSEEMLKANPVLAADSDKLQEALAQLQDMKQTAAETAETRRKLIGEHGMPSAEGSRYWESDLTRWLETASPQAQDALQTYQRQSESLEQLGSAISALMPDNWRDVHPELAELSDTVHVLSGELRTAKLDYMKQLRPHVFGTEGQGPFRRN